MEVDVKSDKKSRERMDGAATAVPVKHGEICSAQAVQDGPKSSTTFVVKSEPPALPCRDNVSVYNGAAAPKSCLSPLGMRSPTVVSGLLPTGKASTTTRSIFYQLRLRFGPTEETNYERTSTQYALFLVEPASCPLLAEGYTNQIKANSGIRSRRF